MSACRQLQQSIPLRQQLGIPPHVGQVQGGQLGNGNVQKGSSFQGTACYHGQMGRTEQHCPQIPHHFHNGGQLCAVLVKYLSARLRDVRFQYRGILIPLAKHIQPHRCVGTSESDQLLIVCAAE